jgi:hypothetical protein
LVAPLEGPCYIAGYPFEWGPDVVLVLMHLAPIPGSGAGNDCTGVALPAPLLNIVFFLPRASSTFVGPYPGSC